MVTAAIGPAPRVYLVTDGQAAGPRELVDVIGHALRALEGARLPASALAVQLREKHLEARALLDHAQPLRQLTAAVGVRLFINDRIDVALAAGADGVHLGGRSVTPEDVHVVAPHLQIAISAHHVGEVARAARRGLASFVVFGPVFDTPSKRTFGPPQGLDRLREACAHPIPVLAIGGIDIAKVKACRGAGTSGIACIRAVLRNSDPEQALRRFFEAIEST